MTSPKLIGAAAIVASALASPAWGQAAFSNPDACESMFPSANCQNMGPGSPYATSRQNRQYRRTAYRQNRELNRQNSGFWPVDLPARSRAPPSEQRQPLPRRRSAPLTTPTPMTIPRAAMVTTEANRAGTATGIPTPPVTASSAGPAPISRATTAGRISVSKSSPSTPNPGGRPAACFMPASRAFRVLALLRQVWYCDARRRRCPAGACLVAKASPA